jgi:hypothetical protein
VNKKTINQIITGIIRNVKKSGPIKGLDFIIENKILTTTTMAQRLIS